MDSPARPSQAKMVSSTGGTEGSSPASSPASAASLAAAMAAPKFGTLVPNRIFVGGISANTSEVELAQLFSHYGNVKATKIIADRGGVSKGYGFVTFETEEEAKRLQQESECIVLRERKLNIAPAIKKQPFNRSFDGGTGSPPAVPTSTYYYTNGMGIPYQNGMTFYNAGAPAPGAAIAPPTDPAALYQAAGVFGPQATASHQTFAPMMYPMPAPSLYMPQQYQYSPMPYEPYFPGTSAAGAPQFLYATNGTQGTASGGGNGSGNTSSGSAGGTGVSAASSSSTALGPSPPQFQTHFYGPATAASHHHPGTLTGSPHGPPPPPHQVEHLYYSYPPPTHVAQPPPHHGGPPLTLATDQQLLVYTEITGQQSVGDSQICQQEDARSSSSHSEQLQQGGASTSDSGGGGGGGGGQPPEPPGPSAHPLVPLKYPMSNRYASFHPVTIHSTKLPQQQQQQQTNSSTSAATTGDSSNVSDDNANLHYRTVSVYPTSLYIPHGAPYHAASPSAGGSLLPTPPQQPYDMGKYRDHSKSPLVNGPYNKGAPPHGASGLLPPPPAYVKAYNGPALQSTPHGLAAHQKYPRVTTPPARLSHHQQYGKRGIPPHSQQSSVPAYYFSQKPNQYGTSAHRQPPPGQPFVYGLQPSYGMSYPGAHKGYHAVSSDGRHSSRRSAMVNSYRGSNLTMSANTSANSSASSISETPVASASKAPKVESVKIAETGDEHCPTSATSVIATTTTMTTTTTRTTGTTTTETNTNVSAATKASSSSPPPKSHSPTARPLPTVSPSPNLNQVQFFGSSGAGGQRHNTSSTTPGQQRGGGNRFSATSTMSNRGGGKASSVLRQTSGPGKYKMNGIVPPSGKLPVDEASSLGGGGDASTVGRLPITPPATPQQSASEQSQQQLNESCHQMQALSL